ncbi:unnamed protein product [Nyctereutes procyonoides]|uniref:(raccoon dog) hypothetical protein n=1 Tax=Nyctereutes procyonoides TaxID=34880 RepID=A0A811ZID1_NYCPR|nr:unnamed protein product [Nyctereutes procyonoides]
MERAVSHSSPGPLSLSRCWQTQTYEPGVLMQKWAQLCSRTLHMWTTEREDTANFQNLTDAWNFKDIPCCCLIIGVRVKTEAICLACWSSVYLTVITHSMAHTV